MKTFKIKLLTYIIAISLSGCSVSNSVPKGTVKTFDYQSDNYKELCLNYRTRQAVNKARKQSDTIYVYSVAFNYYRVLWYHKENQIYSCSIYPGKIKWKKSIIADNNYVDSTSFNNCFDNSLDKNVQCFETTLDGESIDMIVGSTTRFSSFDSDCIFAQTFPKGSFQYKLKYDLTTILLQNDTTLRYNDPKNSGNTLVQ